LLKVGLTGGIASGKSTVGEMFVQLGARLIRADEISHQLMLPGQEVYDAVVRHFGPEILNQDGTVNRRLLAEAAFGTGENPKSHIAELNRIVHPSVIRRQDEWMDETGRNDPHAIAIVEAALLLEAGAGGSFDRLIVVTCEPEQRVTRWSQRQHVDLEAARREVTRRMAAQWPDEKKIEAADYVIDNSGNLEKTKQRVEKIYQLLRGQADASAE